MRSTRHNATSILGAGIFKRPEIARVALRHLRRSRFPRIAAIHARAKGRPRVEENLFPQFSGAILGLLFGFGSGLFFCWQTDSFQFQRSFQPSLLLAGFATAGTLTGCLLAWILRRRIDPASVRLFSKSILPDETVVLAEVQPGETARVLEILNAAGEEKPVTWAFRVTPGLSRPGLLRASWPQVGGLPGMRSRSPTPLG